MMHKAYEIFDAPAAHTARRVHTIPYELVLSPSLKRLMPEPRSGASRRPRFEARGA